MEYLSADHLYAVADGTVIVVLRRPPTSAVLNAVETRVRALARTRQTQVAYLHVVLDVPTTGRVDEDTRTAFIATARRTLPHIEGAAMVLLREGFAGAAMRAAVTGALMVLRPTVPVRIFSSVDDGTGWLASLPSSPRRDAAELSRTATRLGDALLENYAPTT